LKNHVKRVRALVHLMVDDFIPILREIILTYLEKEVSGESEESKEGKIIPRKKAVKLALAEW